MPKDQLDNSLIRNGLYQYAGKFCSGFTPGMGIGPRELKTIKRLDGKMRYPTNIASVGDQAVVDASADALCLSIGQEKERRRKKSARRGLTGNIEAAVVAEEGEVVLECSGGDHQIHVADALTNNPKSPALSAE